jgi:hypothetical protein
MRRKVQAIKVLRIFTLQTLQKVWCKTVPHFSNAQPLTNLKVIKNDWIFFLQSSAQQAVWQKWQRFG